MRNEGLLRRAAALRARDGGTSTFTSTSKDAGQDKSSGITVEESRVIRAEIDEVARKNRIDVNSATFVISALRRGAVFPLIVNAIAVIVTAGGLIGLSWLFTRKDADLAAGSAVVSSAEGRLLQELKRESDSRLLEKDKAIAEVQDRLKKLDQEKNDLTASLSDRVKRREAELRAELQVELERERRRLQEQGFSEAAIQERLKKFEAERQAAFNRELADFQRKAEAEKAAAEENYRTIRSDYQKSIQGLGEERKRIQDEARRREEELRTQSDARARELEAQGAEARAGLLKAKAELARLEEQRAKATAAEDRVLGLYATIRTALRARRFEEAAAGSAALVSYLNDPSVNALPGIQARRDSDIFVADALGGLARSELEKTSADATRLLRQSELLAAARESSAAAEQALKAGDTTTAEARYRETLEKVPEILAAHSWFINRAKDAEAARVASLESGLAAADRAYRAGDTAQASARYAEALSYLPMDDAARATLLNRLGQSGALEADKTRRAADSRAAAGPMAGARRDLDARRWDPAMSAFISVLASWPAAEQTKDALEGLKVAQTGLSAEAKTKAEAWDTLLAKADASGKQVERLSTENQELGRREQLARAEAASSKTDSEAALASLAKEKDARIGALETQVRELSARLAESAGAAQAANPAAATSARAAQDGDLATLRAERDRFKQAAERYDALAASYRTWSGRVRGQLASADRNALVSARTSLNDFLSGGELVEALPGFKDIIAQYFAKTEQYSRTEGAKSDLANAAQIVVDPRFSGTDGGQRRVFLDEMAKRYAANEWLSGFVEALRKATK